MHKLGLALTKSNMSYFQGAALQYLNLSYSDELDYLNNLLHKMTASHKCTVEDDNSFSLLKFVKKTSLKGFLASKCDVGNWIFSKS